MHHPAEDAGSRWITAQCVVGATETPMPDRDKATAIGSAEKKTAKPTSFVADADGRANPMNTSNTARELAEKIAANVTARMLAKASLLQDIPDCAPCIEARDAIAALISPALSAVFDECIAIAKDFHLMNCADFEKKYNCANSDELWQVMEAARDRAVGGGEGK